jgi:predicted amidohydrolase YtcJ
MLLCVFGTFLFCHAETKPADVILLNARIYTVSSRHPWAEALAVRGDKILAVGTIEDMEPFRSLSTKIIDAQKHVVLPGFEDCHVHFMDGSLGLTRVDLNEASTVAEIQARVKAYAASHPGEPWIQGMGWTYPTFAPSGLPDKKILDDVVPDRPVYLVAFDGHSSWANSKALAAAGIKRDTPDPPNGKIVRDSKGEATGALLESAGDLVGKAAPEPSREQRLAALRVGIREANKDGITRVDSAGQDFEYLDLYDELRRKDQLTLRFYIAYFLDPPELKPEQLQTIEAASRKYRDGWISAGAVKMMLDGVVEAHTAAMLEPYSDDPTLSGKLFWDPQRYDQAVIDLDRRELQIFTHAIGDKAVRTALDAYDLAQKSNHSEDNRPRIEHIEIISPEDVPRFAKLGVVASMQPLHANPDDDTLKIWARNAGPERAKHAWVWNTIRKTGGDIAFGSDWPVVTINPWYGLQTAVTRQTRDGQPPDGFLPAQRLAVEEAVRAYTLGAAYAAFREKSEGSLEPGKLADLIMISQDIFRVNPDQIYKTEVFLTMVGGKVVYQSPAWKPVERETAVQP